MLPFFSEWLYGPVSLEEFLTGIQGVLEFRIHIRNSMFLYKNSLAFVIPGIRNPQKGRIWKTRRVRRIWKFGLRREFSDGQPHLPGMPTVIFFICFLATATYVKVWIFYSHLIFLYFESFLSISLLLLFFRVCMWLKGMWFEKLPVPSETRKKRLFWSVHVVISDSSSSSWFLISKAWKSFHTFVFIILYKCTSPYLLKSIFCTWNFLLWKCPSPKWWGIDAPEDPP